MGEITQHTAAHATMDVRSRHITNPRSTRLLLGKASEYRRRPRSCHVDRLSDRREVAQGVLCFSPNLSKLFFFASEQLGEKRDRYFLPSVFYTPADDTPLISIKNKATGQRASVSGKAREYRWQLPKFHVDPWSRGPEVARDVVRFSPKAEKCLFLPSEMDRDFLSSVSCTPAVRCFLRRLAGARYISPTFV